MSLPPPAAVTFLGCIGCWWQLLLIANYVLIKVSEEPLSKSDVAFLPAISMIKEKVFGPGVPSTAFFDMCIACAGLSTVLSLFLSLSGVFGAI